MKLIVVSDTHYYNNCLFELQKQYPQADYFIHCGDLEGDPDQYPGWIIVRGNNDYDLRLPLNKILEIENHRILIMHSHNMRMCRTEAMVHDALVNNCDIVCFGHTHVPSKQKENN
ncbi:YfcE family phosphodiesterase, partial [Floccifex sp.]